VLALVQQRSIRSQAELQELLRKQGIAVNQATLSRDLRQLGLVKGPAGYAVPAATAPPAGADLALLHAVQEWLLGAKPAQNLVVLRTPAGGAQPLAVALDRAAIPDVLGSIAGDDTVLLVTQGPRAARRIARHVSSLSGGAVPKGS
jgi:transcriptional regulator of arginine metabolism